MEFPNSRMGKYLIFSLVGCAFLFSCTKEIQEIPKDFQIYKNDAGYQIATPLGFNYSEFAPSGKYYYFGYPIDSKSGLRTIELYDSEEIDSCSPSLTGTSQTSQLKGMGGSWGRVDFWDDSEAFYKLQLQAPDPSVVQQGPICTLPHTQEGMSPTAYAFCSQKNGKTVLICISQMTDNPGLAEEIFSTFRWTDE